MHILVADWKIDIHTFIWCQSAGLIYNILMSGVLLGDSELRLIIDMHFIYKQEVANTGSIKYHMEMACMHNNI